MLYKYSAYTSKGKIIKSKIEAESIDKVKTYMLENNLVPIKITEAIDFKSSFYAVSFSQKQKVLIYFFNQLKFYLISGFTIDRALLQVQANFKFSGFNIVLNNIIEYIKKGNSLSEALINLNRKDYFNDFIINIIKSGEVSGTLSNSIKTILNYLKRNYKIYNKIITAMVYPLFVISLSVLVIFVLMLFVIPSITQLFEKSNIELPVMTKIVVNISNVTLKYYYIFIILGIIAVTIFFKYIKSSKLFYKFLSFIKFKIPVYNGIYLNNIIVQFSSSLSVMLNNGVDIITALKICNSIIRNFYYDKIFTRIIKKIKEGEKIHTNFNKYNLFEPMFNSSVETGEQSGKLALVMDETSKFYEDELNEQLDRFVAIIEPLLILILGLIVGFLIFSIMLPIFKISKIMKGGV